jgi:guanine deaminase
MLDQSLRKACENIEIGGGPFGAVIVNEEGEIIAEAGNSVTSDFDPTAHAEVNAIRIACKKLGKFTLDNCVLYSSCEPCAMCMGAIYWSHISKVYYAATRSDAALANFDDKFIYE